MGRSTTSIYPDNLRFTYARSPRASADGRWVVFTSEAPNLVAGQIDVNRLPDIFLQDRQTGTTILVSRAAGTTATAANYASFRPSVSADGRYVAFLSWATNLVPGQVDELPIAWTGEQDVFLFDRMTGSMTLVSRKAGTAATAATGEGLDPFVSADGHYVVFLSTAPDLFAGQIDSGLTSDLFLYDREADTTKLVSHESGSEQTATGHAAAFTVSGNGEWIAFHNSGQIYLYQISTGTTTLVTHASGSPTTPANSGSRPEDIPSISADGSRVAFVSEATDLVAGVTDSTYFEDVFLFERSSGTNTLISAASGTPTVAAGGVVPVISSNGTRIAFASMSPLAPGQTSGNQGNVYLYVVTSGAMTLVSHASSSAFQEGNGYSERPALSEDGTRVLFQSQATDLVTGQTDNQFTMDLFLFDQSSGVISLVNHGIGSTTASLPTPEEDLRRVDAFFLTGDDRAVFTSESADLVPRDRNGSSDVFLYDPSTATNQAISVHAPSLPSITGNGPSNPTSMSADGRFVVFESNATDLVSGQDDHNGTDFHGTDVFLRDRTTGETFLVSHVAGSPAKAGNNRSTEGMISRDGRFVVFSSVATDLIAGQMDGNKLADVFLYERASGLVTLLSHADGSPEVTGNAASFRGLISADGHFIVFSSRATDLVAGVGDGNAGADVFLHDRIAGTTVLISHAAGAPTSAGNGVSEAWSLTPDGNFLAFTSRASFLIDGMTDGNNSEDVFVYDRISGATSLVSRASGQPAVTANAASISPELSGNGRFVTFYSAASNLVPGQTMAGAAGALFLFDRSAGTMALVSHASNSSVTPSDYGASVGSIDEQGDFIAFASSSTNLVAGQIDSPPGSFQPETDVFLYDRRTGTNALVSHAAGSAVTAANGDSAWFRISGDGTQVAFLSSASDLVTGQPLSGFDAYLYHRLKNTTTLLSPASAPFIPLPPFSDVNFFPVSPLISQDGRSVAFSTSSSAVVAQDYNDFSDVFFVSDPVPPADFFAVSPCRLLDTRQSGQGPALVSGVLRTVLAPGLCGIPETARTIAVNLTVVNPSGVGYLTAFQGDFVIPPVASTLTFGGLQTRSTLTIIPLASDGTLGLQAFVAAGGSVHVILDVTGYFE